MKKERVKCGVCSHVVFMVRHDCPGTPGRRSGETPHQYQERIRVFVKKLRGSKKVEGLNGCS